MEVSKIFAYEQLWKSYLKLSAVKQEEEVQTLKKYLHLLAENTEGKIKGHSKTLLPSPFFGVEEEASSKVKRPEENSLYELSIGKETKDSQDDKVLSPEKQCQEHISKETRSQAHFQEWNRVGKEDEQSSLGSVTALRKSQPTVDAFSTSLLSSFESFQPSAKPTSPNAAFNTQRSQDLTFAADEEDVKNFSSETSRKKVSFKQDKARLETKRVAWTRSLSEQLEQRIQAFVRGENFYSLNKNSLASPHEEESLLKIPVGKEKNEAQELEEQNLLQSIPVLAFVGPAGTGKSTRAQEVAKRYNIPYFIDDGLLISGNRIIAGSSAKRAHTRFDSIRQALFADEVKAENMKRALEQHRPSTLMILGTSDGMVEKICQKLGLHPPNLYIYIEDVSTQEERDLARHVRATAGKHTIPVPSMEVKHEFNGYFADGLAFLKKRLEMEYGEGSERENTYALEQNALLNDEKTIVRPTFSSLGSYSISDEAIESLAALVLLQTCPSIAQVIRFHLHKETTGIWIELGLALYYGYNAQEALKQAQALLFQELEHLTSINVLSVHVNALRLVMKKKVG